MNKSRVLLAVGNQNISKILKNYIGNDDRLSLMDQEVMHFRYLNEIIELEQPEILIVHDVFLPSDTNDRKEREMEWLHFLHLTRQKYDNLRIVFLCERQKEDIFLNQIVGIGVLDIFNETAIDMSRFVDQLSNPPRYANVAKFRDRVTSIATVSFEREEEITKTKEQQEDNEESNKDNEKNDSSEEKLTTDTKNTTEGSDDNVEAAPDKIKKRTDKEKTENDGAKVKKDKVKERVIEKLVPLPIEKKIILVGAPFNRNGSTFISHLLSKEIANLSIPVTYIENPFARAYSYDRFDGNRKLDNYRSVFYSHLEDNVSPIITNEWEEDSVNIIARHPEEKDYSEEQISFELFIKILLKVKSSITIIDVGSDWDKKVFRDLREIASNVFMVIEPDISAAHYLEDPNNDKTAYYRYIVEQSNTDLIGNRMDDSLLKNNLIQDLYEEKLIANIPSISSEVVFQCQDKGIFINGYDSKFPTKKMIQPILEKIVPDSMLQRSKKKNNLFTNLLHI